MKTDNSLNQIINLGLSEYEAKVYLALLKKKSLLAREISQISKVPRTRIYEVLAKLIEKGLCIEILNNVKKYKAVEPSVALNRILHYKREDLNKSEELAQSVIHDLTIQYNSEKEVVDPLEYIEVIKNPLQLSEKFMRLFANAKKEVLVFTKSPFTGNRDKLQKQTKQQAKILKSGIISKSIYEIPQNEEDKKWRLKELNFVTNFGEEVRIAEYLPIKMAIFDESIVLIALEDPIHKTLSITSLIIEHKSLAKSLKVLFNTIWENSKDYNSLLS